MDILQEVKVVAIDIAIIPPESIINLAIDLSSQLNAENVKLNKTNQLPHISLLMGGALESQIDEIKNRLAKISSRFTQIPIAINEIKTSSKYTGLHIQRTSELLALQDCLVAEIMPLLKYDSAIESIADYQNAKERTLFWLNRYKERSIGVNFSPHITIGDAKPDGNFGVSLPIKFVARRIAICHLGNYCTCSKIIFL